MPTQNAQGNETGRRKLPNMNEFSPGVLVGISLRELFERLKPHQGKRSALVAEIAKLGRIARTKIPSQREVRANNVLIGMSECQLFSLDENTFTPLFAQIVGAGDDDAVARAFSKHIIENLGGASLLAIADRIRARAERLGLDAIRAELKRDGFTVTTNEGNASKLRLWMEQSAVIDDHWRVDQRVLRGLVGYESQTLADIERLSPQQIAFLNELRSQSRLHPAGEFINLNQVKANVNLAHNANFLPEGQFRAKIVNQLAKDGWMEVPPKPAGRRGGKIGVGRPSAKLLSLAADIPMPTEVAVPRELRDKLSLSLASILSGVRSSDNDTKGWSLEVLALRILTELGLRPNGFRVRARQANYTEADLTADGVHLHYSRWVVQCKNTESVTQNQLTREVGVATMLRAHVILMITTGEFHKNVRSLADLIALQGPLQVILLDRDSLHAYEARGANGLMQTIKAQAEWILSVKKPQLEVVAADVGIDGTAN